MQIFFPNTKNVEISLKVLPAYVFRFRQNFSDGKVSGFGLILVMRPESMFPKVSPEWKTLTKQIFLMAVSKFRANLSAILQHTSFG